MKSPEIKVFFDNEKLAKIRPLVKTEKIIETVLPFIEGKQGPAKINLVFVDDFFIKRLNAEFRKIDEATDVLSFNYGEEENQGEIYIDVQYLEKEKGKLKISLDFLVDQAIVHGLLHLFGYDHAEKQERETMEKAERKILERLGD